MKTYLKLNNDVLNRYSTTGLLELEKIVKLRAATFRVCQRTFALFYRY